MSWAIAGYLQNNVTLTEKSLPNPGLKYSSLLKMHYWNNEMHKLKNNNQPHKKTKHFTVSKNSLT